MVKRIISAAFLFLPLWVAAQNCNICPSGTTVTLQSTYPPAATHYWSCTNGFTSNLVSPTFTPAADVTCTLVVTDASGCTSTSQTIVDICNCDCNDPCVSMNYNSTTDCVTFNNTGSNCSPVATDVIEWKNQNTSYATIANGSQICNCDIKEYVNTSAAVTINGSDFRLTINGLQNRCSTCSGSNMRIDFQFPLSGSTSSFPGCAATTDWLTISPAQFATNGYVCDAYVRYTTPFGIVVNQYRFQYNGGGLNVANVTVTEIVKRTIYKDITARRTVTYTDGCPQEQCEILLDIPQQPNDPCTHFVAYVSNVNIGAPCNGPGYNANTINGTAPITYQWYYNGTLLTGQTGQFFCLVGQPFGTYCVQITDAAGCTENVCRVYQASCNLTASITLSGTTLTAVLTGCTGTATYQWQRWNGTAWVNVGTNASTYNTGGVAGDYRVNVTCSGPPVCNAIATYTYTPPCTADVTITTGTTTLTANVTGCGGVNITYVWDRWNGTAWVTVQTVTTTSTSNVYTPTLSGLYRVTITCGSCSDQAQTSWTAPNPCTGFSAAITGTFTGLCVGTAYTYNRTITGGTAPYTQTWKVNGTTVGTGTSYTYTPTAVGTYTLTVTVVDANNCSYTDTKTLTVINCCGLSVSLSPDITVCVNQSGTFTATPTGGTAPITYSWTSQLPPAAPVSQGTGNPKSLTFATAGTYTVQVTATDANNCTAVASRNMVVQNCTNCTCTPTLTLVGCQLQGGTTGAGCGNFSYQLQYSPTGTGWTTVLSGVAFNGWTFTHTPAANGVYRLVIFATGCNLQQTPDVVVNCVPNCSCTAGTLTFASCNLTWTNPCSGAGYTADLEYFDGTSWVYVTQTTPYTPQLSGQYRVKYAKAGCLPIYSPQVTVFCDPNMCTTCTLAFSQYDNNAVGRLSVGNVVSNSNPTCTVGNYVIDWYLNSVSPQNKILVSGVGSDPVIEVQHPFIDNSAIPVLGGTYIPVIRYIYLNGVLYAPITYPGALVSPSLAQCLPSVVVQDYSCTNGILPPTFPPDPLNFTHYVSYAANTNFVDATRTIRFNYTPGSDMYLAYFFEGLVIADRIQFIHVLNGVETVLLDLVVGTDNAATDLSGPIKIIDRAVEYNLLSLPTTANSYLLIKITPSYNNPTNQNTSWNLGLRCLTTFDCSEIVSSPTINCSVNNCTTTVSGTVRLNPYLSLLGAAVQGTAYSYINSGTSCPENRIGPPNTACYETPNTIITKTGNSWTIQFGNTAAYNTYKTAYDVVMAGLNAGADCSSASLPSYYNYLLFEMHNGVQCGDVITTNYYAFHYCTSTFTWNPGTNSVSISTAGPITNQYVPVGPCDNCNTTISQTVSLINNTANMPNFTATSNIVVSSGPLSKFTVTGYKRSNTLVTSPSSNGATFCTGFNSTTPELFPIPNCFCFTGATICVRVVITDLNDPCNNYRFEYKGFNPSTGCSSEGWVVLLQLP